MMETQLEGEMGIEVVKTSHRIQGLEFEGVLVILGDLLL